jgi:hypothetical protein
MADARINPERPRCPRCGTEMNETEAIAPLGNDPGLRIFECSACGSATSRLEPARPNRSPVKGRVSN